MSTRKEREQEEAKRRLIDDYGIKPGDTIYTNLKHVSRSGMYRCISLHIIRDERLLDISYTAAILLEGYDNRHNGCKASGVGMDMGFHLVYSLGWALFGDGWECTGEGCGHNSHVNDWNSPRGKGVMHKDGGYALHQRWM